MHLLLQLRLSNHLPPRATPLNNHAVWRPPLKAHKLREIRCAGEGFGIAFTDRASRNCCHIIASILFRSIRQIR